MRNTDTVTIDDKKYTINELTVKEIMTVGNALMESDLDLVKIKNMLPEYLKLTSSITLDELIDMAPSDIKELIDKWKEVNSSFFDISRQVGLTDFLAEFKVALISLAKAEFGKLVVALSKKGT